MRICSLRSRFNTFLLVSKSTSPLCIDETTIIAAIFIIIIIIIIYVNRLDDLAQSLVNLQEVQAELF